MKTCNNCKRTFKNQYCYCPTCGQNINFQSSILKKDDSSVKYLYALNASSKKPFWSCVKEKLPKIPSLLLKLLIIAYSLLMFSFFWIGWDKSHNALFLLAGLLVIFAESSWSIVKQKFDLSTKQRIIVRTCLIIGFFILFLILAFSTNAYQNN